MVTLVEQFYSPRRLVTEHWRYPLTWFALVLVYRYCRWFLRNVFILKQKESHDNWVKDVECTLLPPVILGRFVRTQPSRYRAASFTVGRVL